MRKFEGNYLMKILIIRNIPNFMDVCHNTYNIQEVGLAKALSRMGHECDIVFWTDGEEREVRLDNGQGAFITVFYKKGKTILKNCIYSFEESFLKSYDILQPCEYNQVQSVILAKKYPEKTVVYHGPYFDEFNKRYNLMCKLLDPIIIPTYKKMHTKFMAKSNLAKDFLVSKGISPDNIAMVGVGMDSEMLSSSKKHSESDILGNLAECEMCNSAFFDKISQQKSGKKLLYIGRMEERRNVLFLLDVFSEYRKYAKDAVLYMIGTGDDEYCNRVRNKISELGIGNSLVWEQKMEQKYLSNIYKLTDAFLLPTRYEIFGMVLLEAMYYGNIVFTTQNGGSNVLIDNDENGVIITDKDANVWAGRMHEVLENKHLVATMAQKASLTIRAGYTWDERARLFVEAYEGVGKEKCFF